MPIVSNAISRLRLVVNNCKRKACENDNEDNSKSRALIVALSSTETSSVSARTRMSAKAAEYAASLADSEDASDTNFHGLSATTKSLDLNGFRPGALKDCEKGDSLGV